MSTDNYTLHDRSEYLRALTAAAQQAGKGDRVLVIAMSVWPEEPLVAYLFDQLQAAAQRGAAVHIGVDAHEFLINDADRLPGPLWWRGKLPHTRRGAFGRRLAVFDELRAAGIHIGITNQPARRFAHPFAGRSHIKTAVVNDQLFVGGCNLSNAAELDVMVGWRNAAHADWLYKLLRQVIETEQTAAVFKTQDVTHRLTQTSSLLIDAGVHNQSLIYDHALTLIDQAQDWLVMTCQYFPNGATAQALKRALERGVTVRLLFNHPRQHPWPHNVLHWLVQKREGLRLPPELFQYKLPKSLPYMHAKILASETSALIGSHNYVEAGVRFGTAEIALYVQDAAFAEAAARFAAHLSGQEQAVAFLGTHKSA